MMFKQGGKTEEEQIEELKPEFLQLDLDRDGTISIIELARVLISMRGKLKASETEIKRALRQFDKDGDGEIDLIEYHQTMLNTPENNLVRRALVMRALARQDFRKIDVDGSGYISTYELKNVLQEKTRTIWSNEQIEAVVQTADRNKDGQLNYEEFLLTMYGKLDDIVPVFKFEGKRKRLSFKGKDEITYKNEGNDDAGKSNPWDEEKYGD